MKKYLITTSSDDRFAPGVAVLLHSLKKHMSRLDEVDIKVFYTNLSDQSKEMISGVYKDVIFEKPDNFDFCKNIKTLYGADNQDTYLCFHAFRQHEYEKVICLDSDMMCVGDISPLLDYAQPLMACLGQSNMNLRDVDRKQGIDKFNAGFMVINRQHLKNSNTYSDLVNIVNNAKTNSTNSSDGKIYRVMHKTSETFNDQDAIKIYWRNRHVMIVPDWYNFKYWGGLSGNAQILANNKRLLQFFDDNIDKIKIIHYSGKRKPWGNRTNRDDGHNGRFDVCSVGDHKAMLGVKAVDLWHQYYEECFGKKCQTDWYHRR